MQTPSTPEFEIPITHKNAALAAAINRRIDAETANVRRANMLMAAKAALWRMAGYGLCVSALGLATGLAFVGYSFISDNRASLDQLTAAFSKALQTATLHTDGSVGLKPDASVALANGGHVTLDPGSVALAPGATVNLAPGSTVSMKPDAQEIIRRVRTDTATEKTGAAAVSFDEVTAFHENEFKHGRIISGWKYHADNNFASPYYQFCYYQESDEGNANLGHTFQMATNGKLNAALKNPFHLNIDEAFQQCAWHS